MDGENLGDDLMAYRARTVALVREGFAAVRARPDVFTSVLYEDFFTANPRYRKYFGSAEIRHSSGEAKRRDERTLEAATRIVEDLDRPGALLPYLRKLAQEYRKYGLREAHYRAFAGSIMTALERTIGDAWSYEAAAAWVDELTMVASAMLGIAAEADAQSPAYWEAEVVSVDRMGDDVVCLKARPAFAYTYQAGQYAAIELGRLPWVWRDFSFAAAPKADENGDGVLEFHVQRSPGGQLSNVVHDELEVGDRIRVAAPAGELAFPAGASRLIAVGHGTGLAPIAALLEEAIEAGDDRPVHVVVGDSLRGAGKAKKGGAKKGAKAGAAPAEPSHYLAERLDKIAQAHGDATVAYVGDAETLPQKLDEYVKELAGDGTLSGWGGVAVGSTATVTACLEVLAAAGADPADVRSDLFG